MATAMAFPEAKRGMHSELKNLTGSAKVYLSQARYVLRNSPMVEGERYPRRCFPHGQFLPWIAAEFEMSDRTANDFMNAYRRFGDKSAIIADFKPTILYALSAPSTPDSVIEKAIEQAEAGEKVAVAGAVPIRQCPSPPPHQRPKSDGLCY